MRVYDASAQNERERNKGLIQIPMILISAKNRDTGVEEHLGMWLGGRTEIITVVDLFTHVASKHTFYVGGLLTIPHVQYQSGLDVRPHTVTLSAIDDSVLAAMRLYNARGAKIQGWNRTYNSKWQPYTPEPVFKGYINHMPVDHAAVGNEVTIELEAVSTAMMLTVESSSQASNAYYTQYRDDAIMKYADNTVTWDVPWGAEDDKDHKENNPPA